MKTCIENPNKIKIQLWVIVTKPTNDFVLKLFGR